MKYIIQFTLFTLASSCFVFFVLLGIDMSVANRDYETMARNGDFEGRVEGCIFDLVCKHYTEQLWEK